MFRFCAECTDACELTVQVQQAILVGAQMEVGHPGPIILHLSKIAARTLASEDLFRKAYSMHPSLGDLS